MPETRVALELAGVHVTVSLEHDAELAHIEARFGRFRSNGSAADTIELRVVYRPGVEAPQPQGVAWPGASGSVRDTGVVRFERLGESLEYDPARRRALAVIARTPTPGLEPVHDPTSIDTPLRLLLSYELPRVGGFLVHATGYGDARGAVLFPAASGGGKTTTANKLAHENVLSDDQVAVRRSRGVWSAYALPFVGMYGRAIEPRIAPVRAVMMLAKGAAASERLLRRPVALARLFACCPCFVRDDDTAARLLEHVGDFVAAAPVGELVLARDTPVMPFVERVMAAT